MCDCDLDVSPIVEELQWHRPLFPANGWRVIFGSTHKNGKQTTKELPVLGLVWNSDNNEEGLIDFVVWFCAEARCLSTIKDCESYIAYKWPVPPASSFDGAMKDARAFLEGEKAEDLEELHKVKVA